MQKYLIGLVLTMACFVFFAAVGTQPGNAPDASYMAAADESAALANTAAPASFPDALNPHERAALTTGEQLTASLTASTDTLQRIVDRHRPARRNDNAP